MWEQEMVRNQALVWNQRWNYLGGKGPAVFGRTISCCQIFFHDKFNTVHMHFCLIYCLFVFDQLFHRIRFHLRHRIPLF